MEPGEIDIAPIHDVDCARLREQQVERVNVVQLAIRNVDEARDVTAQVQERVHLDRRLGRAEMRPRKDRQTKIDGRRVERIDRVGEVETQILVDVQPSRLGDQSLGQLRVMRQSRVSLASASVERRTGSRKPWNRVSRPAPTSRFRWSRRLSRVGQLGERHGPIMLGAGQRPHPLIAAVPRDNPRERAPRQKIHQLSEKRLATVHRRLLGNLPKSADRVQIDTTLTRPNCIQNHPVKGRRPGLNGQQ